MLVLYAHPFISLNTELLESDCCKLRDLLPDDSLNGVYRVAVVHQGHCAVEGLLSRIVDGDPSLLHLVFDPTYPPKKIILGGRILGGGGGGEVSFSIYRVSQVSVYSL